MHVILVILHRERERAGITCNVNIDYNGDRNTEDSLFDMDPTSESSR